MIEFRKVAFYTLGCKLNFSETSTIAKNFENEGFARVSFEDTPDVFVINTCSVTENADKKCKQLVRKAQQINPNAFVAIIGCYAQLKPTEIAAIPGVDIVLGANEKFNLPYYISSLESKPENSIIKNGSIKDVTDFKPAHSMNDRTRSFLKVQDGCDYFCTFCTIPLARGKSRNASILQTVGEAQKIAASNVKEVVLTGVNIGDYGQGGDENFLQLIEKLDKVNGIDRFRISSIEPNLLTNEIIHFCLEKSNKFTPHFHIPLQAGNDRLLKAMRRKYNRNLFKERVEYIKKLSPSCCIGVDVIVGFPGETEEEFLDSYQFINDLDVSYLHVFTYSERANTTAVKLGHPVPMDIRKKRSRQLHILSDKKRRAFYESMLDQNRTVLFEQDEDEGFMYGFTENYVKVRTTYDIALVNQMIPVKLIDIGRDGTVDVDILKHSKIV
jgi:threonylcarbamoyladenosine tRNA methylthiotransferase MtaB